MTRGSSTFSAGGMAGSEPVARMALELHLFLAAGRELHAQVVCVDDLGPTPQYRTLRCFTSWPVPLVRR
jgi:hypothetical protein